MDTIEMNTPDDVALADRMKVGRDRIITELKKTDRRAGRHHQPGAVDAVCRRQQPDRRRAGTRQDAVDPHHGARARAEVLAHPVHARPDAVGHHRHRHHPGRRVDRPPPDGVLAGPIFANIVLADEINRTPPKTQSALLEAMQEHGSPSRAAPTSSKSRSTSLPRRTRSSSKAPIRCPKRSSIASCSTS